MSARLLVGCVAVLMLPLGACAQMDPAEESKEGTSADVASLHVGDDGAADSVAERHYQGELRLDELFVADLTRREPYHTWGISVAAGDRVFIDLANRDGRDTFVALYHHDGGNRYSLVASNDDCYTGTLNACLDEVLEEGGDYRVLATSYSYAFFRRAAAFQYHLTVSCHSEDGTCGSVGDACGGRGTGPCPDGYFCNFPQEAACGMWDAQGVCELIPPGCDRLYAPVCGCDGVTYGNECTANRAGVSAASDGECPGQGVGETCGGIAALQCEGNLECDYSGNDTDAGCFPDMGGVCAEPSEMMCIQLYDPVCGCDGVTYGNDCMRRNAGAALDHPGECCDCGPAMGMPNTLCPDGVTVSGPTGVCLQNGDGTCGWEVITCPE